MTGLHATMSPGSVGVSKGVGAALNGGAWGNFYCDVNLDRPYLYLISADVDGIDVGRSGARVTFGGNSLFLDTGNPGYTNANHGHFEWYGVLGAGIYQITAGSAGLPDNTVTNGEGHYELVVSLAPSLDMPPPPHLTLTNNHTMTMSWPRAWTNLVLVSTTILDGTNIDSSLWSQCTNAVRTNGANYSVAIDTTAQPSQFFKLRSNPIP